jgi:hypothetical protein
MANLSQTESLMSATDRQKLAREFLEGAKWKLIFSRGSGKSVNGMKTRVRIYATGCPANALHEVQQLLSEEIPVLNPQIDGVAMSGTYYHRTSWWAGKIGAPMSVTPGTVSIIRELTDDVNLQNTNTVEDDCGNTTTIRFVWDAESIEDVTLAEHSGDQGYQVKIGGVNRDPETGFYSYYVTTTERKYLNLPEHVTGEDAFSTDYAEAWLGMRGTIAAPTDDAGAPVAVLNPDVFEAGVSKGVSWRRNNDDCTLDAEGRKKVAKRDITTMEACQKDIFKEADAVEVSAQVAKLGHAPAAANGVKKSHKSDLRADGLFVNRIDTDTEKKVVDSRKVDSSTVYEVEASTVQTNIPVAEVPALPAAGNGRTYSLQVEKTPGDLRVAALSSKQELAVAEAKVVRETDLLKDETTVESVAATPLGAPTPAGAGKITANVDTLTPGGYFRRQQIVKQAKAAASWVVSTVTMMLSRTTSTTSLNQPTPLITAVIPEVGIRKERVKRSNPDGTFEWVTQDTESVQATTGVLLTQKDQFKEAVVERVRNRRGFVQADAAGGTGGIVAEASNSLQEDGTADVTTQKVTEKPVTLSKYDVDQTLYGKRITERNEHQTVEMVLAAEAYGSVGYEKTPGGLKNTMKTYWDLSGIPADGRILMRVKGGDATHNYETIQRFFPVDPGYYPKTGLVVADGWVIYTSKVDAHESGGFIRTDTVETPIVDIIEWIDKVYIYEEDNYNNTGETATINLYRYIFQAENARWDTLVAEVEGFLRPDSFSFQWNLNKYGLYSGSVAFESEQVTYGT